MRSRSQAERSGGTAGHGEAGAVTAEFATAMPAVILVLACCLAGGQLATQQLRLQDAASGAARAAARGTDPGQIRRQVARLVPRASVSLDPDGGVTCVTVTLPAALGNGLSAAVTLRARGCALGEGD